MVVRMSTSLDSRPCLQVIGQIALPSLRLEAIASIGAVFRRRIEPSRPVGSPVCGAVEGRIPNSSECSESGKLVSQTF